MAITYMTQEGYDKKMAELAHLENVERPMLEAKIAELKTLIASARIIDESKISTDEVQLLTKVTIRNLKNKAQVTYMIVTETEANLREGKISISTPIAKGLLGHKVGDTVEVQAPAGLMKFEILKIEV